MTNEQADSPPFQMMDEDPVSPSEDAAAPSANPPRQSIGRNMAATLAAQAVSWALAFITVTQLPRYLGAEDVGQLRVAATIWILAAGFVGFGTDRSVTLQVARSEDDLARIMASAIRLRLIVTVGACAVIAGVLAAIGADETLAVLVLIAGTGAIGKIVGTVATSVLQGLENFGSLAKVTTTLSVVTAAGVVLGIVFDVGLYPIALLLAGTEILGGVLRFHYLRRLTQLGWRTTMPEVRATAKRGLPYLLGGVALILYHEADTIVMAFLVDNEQIGWYTSADRLFGTALIIPTTLMTTMMPVLARVHATEPDRARTMAEQTYRTLLLLGLPAGAGLFLVSDRLAILLFGDDFAGSGPVLAALGPVLALVSITILLGRYALAIGREKTFYTMLLVAAVATVPLDLLFVPFFDANYDNGAIGGAVSFAVTEVIILVVGTALLLPSAVSTELWVRLTKVGAATVAMGAAVYPLRDEFPLLPIGVGTVVFVVAALVLRTAEPHERDMAEPVFRRVRAISPIGR